MERTTFEKFFTGKRLRVPPYQRDYAWEEENIDDLWDDLKETLDLSTSHYLGTFILAQSGDNEAYDIVDGQQRLVTLTMLLQALIQKLGPGDSRQRIVTEELFLEDRGNRRLTLLGNNQSYFEDLLAGKAPLPTTGGQKRLSSAFRRINEKVDELASRDASAVGKWLDGISDLLVLEFVENDAGNAIRIFESVNDRGRPLATVDKIKSFLIYVSNYYLKGELDSKIQERFGRVFRSFDEVKELGKRIGVAQIQQERFTEDSVVLYHFLAYPSEKHDYHFAGEDVLDQFLKPTVKNLVRDKRFEELKDVVDGYSEDLACFFEGFCSLLRLAEKDPHYLKLFWSLPISVTLYPLIIRLAVRNLLSEQIPNKQTMTFLDAIEVTDVRVYKTRGTAPRKDIYQLACDSYNLPPAEIGTRIADFVRGFMDDPAFKYLLSGSVYKENEGTRHILLEWDEKARLETTGKKATVDELRDMMKNEPTIDHVLAQEGSFKPQNRGFKDEEDFLGQLHRLGNLTLVEKVINSGAQGKTPEQKASEERLYRRSTYPSTRRLGTSIEAEGKEGGQFDSTTVKTRSDALIRFCLDRWALW